MFYSIVHGLVMELYCYDIDALYYPWQSTAGAPYVGKSQVWGTSGSIKTEALDPWQNVEN